MLSILLHNIKRLRSKHEGESDLSKKMSMSLKDNIEKINQQQSINCFTGLIDQNTKHSVVSAP